MANHLKMALSELIVDLFRQGWSKRKIARQLGVDRGTVVRHIRQNMSTATAVPAAVVVHGLPNGATSKVATGPDAVDLAPKAATPGKVATGFLTLGTAPNAATIDKVATGSGPLDATPKAATLGEVAAASGPAPSPKQATLTEVATGSAQVPAASATLPSTAPAAVGAGRSKCEPYQKNRFIRKERTSGGAEQ